jgi:hypothetical protein
MTGSETKLNLLKPIAIALCVPLAALALAACGGDDEKSSSSSSEGLPTGSEPVNLKPEDFTLEIDNRYWPMTPGNRWVFEETNTKGDRERVVTEVTDRTKMTAAGIEARVIRDEAHEDGKPVEITDDWYAQDKDGNLWYFGEAVNNYENGKLVDHKGSWEAGKNGAQAGIAMPAEPKPGMVYRQEYSKGVAEDHGAVVTVGKEKVEVPFGFFNENVLMTRDTAPIEPKVEELKFYAPNVGPVLSVHTDGDGGRAELVSYRKGG